MLKVFKTLFTGLCLTAAVFVLGLAGICLLNPHRPLLYLIDIFTVPLMSGTIVLAALLTVLRQKWAGGIAGLAALVFLVAVWPQAHPAQQPADMTQPAVRLAYANLLIRNEIPEKLLPWIEKQNPDIVALLEVNPHAREALIAGLRRDRPYVVTRYDMVIASRYPLGAVQRHPAGFALITTTVKTPGGNLKLALAHLTRPWPFTDPGDQPRQLARLQGAIKPLAGDNFVMVGDFNTSPAGSHLRDFNRRAGLHTAPAYRGTWPSVLPGPLRTTIDNAMASSDLNLSRRQTGPFTGSDHRPIVVDIYAVKQ